MTVLKNSKKAKIKKGEQLDLLSLIESATQGEDVTPWSGTLQDYLFLVEEDPGLNDYAHTRIWRMIENAGITFNDDDDKKKLPRYKFFENDLFGVDNVLAQVMQYFKAAAAGSEVSRRILLLWGPTSSGKSQFAILLKQGLEKFTRTKEGRMFGIEGCPMHENPLNAVPLAARKVIEKQFGISIEGELCPRCAYRLENELNGDWKAFPVKRVFMSEMTRVGIGTFQPGDTKSQSQSELVGSVNFAKLEDYGVESHPLAYNFDGELNVANRGLMEFIEMLKVDPKFRHILLTLAQEKRIKVERFPLIYADLVPLAHSVAGDSPIPYMKGGKIKFDTIASLTEKNDTDIKVLAVSSSGDPVWTDVKSFFSHQFSGKLVKTVQKNGVVDTTWNHSIIGKNLDPFYPEDKKDVLAFRKLPRLVESENVTVNIPLPDTLSVVEGRAYVKPTGNKKRDGEYGKYWVKSSYDMNSSEIDHMVKVLAWYITEGHVNTSHAIISQANMEILQNIKLSAETVSSSKGSIQDRSDKEDRTSRLHLSTRVWREVLEFNCGKYSENKRIPNFIFELPEQSIRKFFYELVEGDGTRAPSNSNISSKAYLDKCFRYKTTSKMLASQIGFIASMLGLDYSVSHSYTSTGKEAFEIRYRESENSVSLNKVEITEVEDLTVYDIECEGNHSFTAGVGSVVCHNTNETEFNKFLANKSEEALHDRLWVVKFPYNLELDSEVKIYEKLVCHTPAFKSTHIAPHTLKVAAMFAILSRLEEPKDKSITRLQKMHLYNGDDVDGFTKENVKDLQKSTEREGLDGVSPRYIVNRLAACFAKHDVNSITPIDALRSIQTGLTTNAKLDKEEIARLENLISDCVEEYNKVACNEVQKAFFVNFEHEIKNLLENYIDNVGCYLNDSKVENEWGDYEEPDERLMRNIEEKVGITDSGKDTFREEIYRKMLESKSREGKYDYQSHPRLKEALQKQLFAERSDVIRLTVSSRNPDPEGLKKLNEVISVLCDRYDYSVDSANELLRYVSNIMSKSS